MCGAQCSHDAGRAGVLQEDGEAVWRHGDGEIPSLLPVNRYPCRFARAEDSFLTIASCQFDSVSHASRYISGRRLLLAGTIVVSGFVHP